MELSQKYAYEIYKLNSFSKAAKTFFISQPSLSAMIKKLENELGFKIFDRSKNPLVLTPEGKIYIAYLEECIENERLMKLRIKTLSAEENIELMVGGGSFFSCTVYPEVCKKLHATYPNLILRIDLCADEARKKLTEKLEAELLDLGFHRSYDKDKFIGIPIIQEKYFLVMRNDIAGAENLAQYNIGIDGVLSAKETYPEENSDYKIPPGMRLVRPSRYPLQYAALEEYLNQFEISKTTVTNFRNNEIIYDMVLKGLGAAIVSDILIAKKYDQSKDILFIPINHSANTRMIYLIHKKRLTLSEPAKEFISVLKNMCKNKSEFMKNLAKGLI